MSKGDQEHMGKTEIELRREKCAPWPFKTMEEYDAHHEERRKLYRGLEVLHGEWMAAHEAAKARK